MYNKLKIFIMKSKIEKLEKFMAAEGLTLEKVNAYYADEREKAILAQEQKEEEARRQKIAKLFPANDVRSKALLYDYAFEGGKFSSDKDAYPNCQGVVGWINPDINAPEGDRVYIVLFDKTELHHQCEEGVTTAPYCCRDIPSTFCETGINDFYDGRTNTKRWLEYGKQHDIKFEAAEYAFDYCKNGVKQGEAFIPAREQLMRVFVDVYPILCTLNWNDILVSIDDGYTVYLMSSSEYNDKVLYAIQLSQSGADVKHVGWNVICYKYMRETVALFLAY